MHPVISAGVCTKHECRESAALVDGTLQPSQMMIAHTSPIRSDYDSHL
jgi:hypothetical protein